MSANNSGIISLIEAGSGYDPEKPLDPTLLRYRTSIFPDEVGAELIVKDLEQFRILAEAAEPRLRPYLLKIAYTMDCALAAKSSEGGKMLDLLNATKTSNSMFAFSGKGSKSKDPLDKLNSAFGDFTSSDGNPDVGNKNY